MPNNSHLTELQKRLLAMMKWFHQYCVDNSITYYMVGGTMLGAARHQGFIPWDDDVDISIPRRDYNRLLEISRKLDGKSCPYVIESYLDGNDDFEYPFAKVYDTRTTLIENKRKQPKRGIYLDLFPLDGIGTSMEDARRNFRPICWNLNLLTARSCAVRDGRSGVKNMIVRAVGILPPFILNPQRLLRKIDRLCQQRDFDEYPYGGGLVGNWRWKELMLRSSFGKPVLYPFEDAEFFGIENYDDYLTHLYGDWRTPPPVEKRKSEHDFTDLDLDHSYLD